VYVNPWRFSVGDLVATMDEFSGKIRTGVIVDRRRKEVYVEARPIRCIEIDEYCVIANDRQCWIPEINLEMSQPGLPDVPGAAVLSPGDTHE
jgi:hypothetical protein